MPLTILATSDIHLGMKFTGYPEIQEELAQARFSALQKLVTQANEHDCDVFIIAGDLFDRLSVTKRDILQARQILGEFQGALVAVLPGNHDFISPGESDLWSRFSESTAGNVLVLAHQNPYPLMSSLDIDACLYPGPCTSKHSSVNTIDWIPPKTDRDSCRFHIGIAHGSLQGLSPDIQGNYFPMTPEELRKHELDLWLLGHTHRPWSQGNVYNPGTPEPDGFDCDHQGSAVLIQMQENGSIESQSVPCGTYLFEHASETVESVSDINRIASHFRRESYQRTILKMTVDGRLSKTDYDALGELRAAVEENVKHLYSFQSHVREEISSGDIDAEFTEGSFPHRLLTALCNDPEDAEALQTAYQLLGEIRS